MKKLLCLVLAVGLAIVLGCSKSEPPKKAPDTKSAPAAGDTAKPKT